MKFLSSERLSQHKYKTPEGYLICVDAILARTGKQTYRKNEIFADTQDDSEVEVDRKAEEVFSPATLASFENKPITVEHPDEDVNAGNHNELSVGFVRDVHKGIAEGQDVMLGTLVITDAQTIAEIENGEHVELSCGYDCDIVDEANPQQRNIRGNHVALCQQGRAGIARIVDSTKDIAPTKASGTDKIVYIMQSDADSNLYFYIGKTFSMKEGAWGYTKYEMGSTSPEQLKAELTRNGWHEVNNGPAKVIDAQSVIFKGENTFIFANKDMIPERTHYKGDVEYNGKEYYYHEGFESKRKYLIPIVDSIKTKDDLVFGYTQKDLDLANNMLSKATTENEKKLIESLIAKIKYEITNKEMRDKLIESGSEEALKKNIATEIKSGKSPEQATAIAYSVKRKHDNINDANSNWINAFSHEPGCRLATVKQPETITGEFATNVWDDGVPVMKTWDRHQTSKRTIKVNTGDKVIIENNKFVWIQIDNGWLCTYKSHTMIDSLKKFEIYDNDKITIVRATSLKEAINKVKGGK